MNKARELLERALEQADYIYFVTCGTETLAEEIREFLKSEEPEKREPLRDEEILNLYVSGIVFEQSFLSAFKAGYRMAEKHYGIQEEE